MYNSCINYEYICTFNSVDYSFSFYKSQHIPVVKASMTRMARYKCPSILLTQTTQA